MLWLGGGDGGVAAAWAERGGPGGLADPGQTTGRTNAKKHLKHALKISIEVLNYV